MLNDYEKAICRKVAATFEIAGKQGYLPVSFTTVWLTSDTFKKLLDGNIFLVSQGYLYLLDAFEKEISEKGIVLNRCEDGRYSEQLYWLGYFFTWWVFMDRTSGSEILHEYDIEGISGCYDTYHTLSVESAVDRAKQDFKKAELALKHFMYARS